MAGGEGTRLRPLTSNTPKPMLPMVNRPMMEHIIHLLAKHGFDDIVVTVAYLANQIRNYFGDGSDFGVRIRYATETEPLGTAGSVRNAAAELDETFLVISGDVLTDIDLRAVIEEHKQRGALASITLKRVEDPTEFGIVIVNGDNSIERFLEKPTWGEVFSDTINTGIYVLEPKIFEFIPEGEACDFSAEVFPKVLEQKLALYGVIAEGYWGDVGNLESYIQAHHDILDGKINLEMPGFDIGDAVYLGEGAQIHDSAKVDGPAIIGANSRIEADTHIGPYTVLGSDVVVESDSTLEQAVLHDHVYVASHVDLRGCVVGRNSDVRNYARISEGVVVAEECFIGDHAIINPQVKVYPFKSVEPGAVVNSSIIWESRGTRTLFGRRGVRGLANVDITPELVVRLGMAYGSSLKKGAKVVTSRGTSRAARSLKRAFIAGLNLSGVNVDDLELSSVPLTRFHVRQSRAEGGVTIRLAEDDPAVVELRFIDEQGCDIDEGMQRKIERIYYREDYRRVFSGEIGDIVFPARVLDFYTSEIEQTLNQERIARQHFKVVLDFSFGAVSVVMPNVLAKVGAEVLAVNPFVSTSAALAASKEEFNARAEKVAELVRSSESDFGMILSPDGERAVLIDDAGHVLTDEEALLCLTSLVCEAFPGARIGLPIAVSREAERIAHSHGAEIVWTKLSDAHLMDIASQGLVDFAASQVGGFIWPDFLPAYDATATVARLCDLLARNGKSLSSIVSRLPQVHVAHEVIPTPWEKKGSVMRQIVETVQDHEMVFVDGVKILYTTGWVLVVPDPTQAVTHVWAEADSSLEARQLAKEYASRIRTAIDVVPPDSTGRVPIVS